MTNTGENADKVREAVGIFDDPETLAAVIDALMIAGFDRADLSILAGVDTVEKKLRRHFSRIEELEDDSNTARGNYVSQESLGAAEGMLFGLPMYVAAGIAAGLATAAGGPLGATLVATVASGGAGAAIGAVLARLLGKKHAAELESQLARGGLLLWVRVWTPQQENVAVEILSEHSAHDVHVHEFAAD